MKTLVSKLFGFAVLLGILGACAAKAQISNEIDFKAPSAFIAGDATLPAGSYTIKPFSSDEPSLLEVSDAAGSHTVLLDTESTESETPAKRTEVIFNKYGSELVLKNIRLQGQQTGYWLDAGNREKALAKKGKPTKQSVSATAK